MAYDEELADRIRDVLSAEPDVTERRMFGGLAFLVAGNMAVAAGSAGAMMVRVDRDRTDELLRIDGVAPQVMSGREIKGWLEVSGGALRTDEQLSTWVRRGVDHARTLPAK